MDIPQARFAEALLPAPHSDQQESAHEALFLCLAPGLLVCGDGSFSSIRHATEQKLPSLPEVIRLSVLHPLSTGQMKGEGRKTLPLCY